MATAERMLADPKGAEPFEEGAPEPPGRLTEGRARQLAAEAERAELRVARENGRVVAVAEATEAFMERLGVLCAALLNVPGGWTRHAVGLKTAKDVARLLERAANCWTLRSQDPKRRGIASALALEAETHRCTKAEIRAQSRPGGQQPEQSGAARSSAGLPQVGGATSL